MARRKKRTTAESSTSSKTNTPAPEKAEPIVSKKRKKRDSFPPANSTDKTASKEGPQASTDAQQKKSPIPKRRKTDTSPSSTVTKKPVSKEKKEARRNSNDRSESLIAFHEQHRPWGFLHSLTKHPKLPLVSAIESITIEEGLPTILLNRDQLSAVVVNGNPSHFSVSSPPDSSRSSPSSSGVVLLKDGDTLTFENGEKKASFVFFLLGFPSLPPFLSGSAASLPSFLDNVPPSLLGGSRTDPYYDDEDDDEDDSFGSDDMDSSNPFGFHYPEGMKKREREREKRARSTPTRNPEGSGALQRGKAITLDDSREHDLWKQEIEDEQDKQKSASSPKHSSSTPRQLPRILEKMMRRGGRAGDRNWKKVGKLLKSGVNGAKQKGKNTSFEEISRYLRLPLQHETIEKFFLSYFEKRIHCPSKDKIAFSNFPFTVPISLQHSLISSSFLHLHGTGFPATLPTSLPPSILLVGPPGSHTMEELLVRALASELDADLMVFDDRGIVGGEVHDMCLVCSSPCCLKAPCCFRFPSDEKSNEVAHAGGMADSSGEESDVGDSLGGVENQDSVSLSRSAEGQKQDVATKFKVGDRVSVATGPVPPFLTPSDQPRATATVIGIVTPIISQPHYRLLYDDSVAQGERMEREEGEWEDEDDEDEEDEDEEGAVTIRVKTIPKRNDEDVEDGGENASKSEMHKQKVKKMMKLVEIDPEDHLTLERSAQEENITLAALSAFCGMAQKRAQERPVIAFFRDVDAAIDNPKRKEIVKKMCDNAGKGRLVCIGGFIRDDSHRTDGPNVGGFFGFGGRGGGAPKDEDADDLSSLTGLIDVFQNPILIPENNEMYGEGWGKWSSFLEKEKKKVKLEMNLIGLKRVMASVPIRLRMEGVSALVKKDGEDNAGVHLLSSLLQSDQQMLENLASNKTLDFCFSHPSLKERDFDHQALSQICAYSLSRIAMRTAKLGESRWWDNVANKGDENKGEEEKKQEKSGEVKPKQEHEECEIDERSLRYGINLYCRQNPQKKTLLGQKLKTLNLDPYERRIAKEVVEPGAIGVRWENIGALNKAKRLLREVVLLPLQRPELFRTGCLSKPCKGVLLFGPPGTGKTMLAKAVATACGAHFLNLTSGILFDKYYGEAEKYHRAVFTLASKLAPCVIFIDEIDSILGKRGEGEHEATRKCKNEFMTLWDGLTSKEYERVLVLGATNRPFDLDEAVLRRMPRRVLVDLPDLSNRIQILKIHLNDETLSKDLDLKAIAEKTDGFSGSDLRQLCVAAAYIRLRDFIRSEEKDQEDSDESKGKEGEKKTGGGSEENNDSMMGLLTESFAENEGNDVIEILEKEVKEPELRPLCDADFLAALKDVKSSVSEEGESVQQLRQWDREYGAGSEASRSFHSIYL